MQVDDVFSIRQTTTSIEHSQSRYSGRTDDSLDGIVRRRAAVSDEADAQMAAQRRG